MKFVPHQFGSRSANEDIDAVNSSKTFQARRQIYCIPDNGRIHPFVGTNIADDDFAVIDPDAHTQPNPPSPVPFCFNFFQRTSLPHSAARPTFRSFPLPKPPTF